MPPRMYDAIRFCTVSPRASQAMLQTTTSMSSASAFKMRDSTSRCPCTNNPLSGGAPSRPESWPYTVRTSKSNRCASSTGQRPSDFAAMAKTRTGPPARGVAQDRCGV